MLVGVHGPRPTLIGLSMMEVFLLMKEATLCSLIEDPGRLLIFGKLSLSGRLILDRSFIYFWFKVLSSRLN